MKKKYLSISMAAAIFSISLPTSSFAIALINDLGGPTGYGDYAMQNFNGNFQRNDDGSSNSLALPF